MLNELLTEIASALLLSDVNIHYINTLRNAVKTQVTLQMSNEMGAANMRRLITKSVVDELTSMLSAPNKAPEFTRGKQHVVMFVGLQGAGKTTTCTKYAYHYLKKGWRVGLVCADTFRAGAFEQLKQNAAKVKCPFYGHKKETDPVKIAEEGVAFFRKQKYEIIIVDTSGRHKQETALFDEMKQVQAAVNPDQAIFVMDGSIGQACYGQAKAFKESVRVGSVICTKLDGHAKGGGSMSAVAATESPIIFLGTGEHFEDLEAFDPSQFVKRLLGMGDMSGLVKTLNEAMSSGQQKHLIDQIKKGQFTLRDMRDQFSSVMQMGPLNQVVGMIPGFNANMIPKGQEKESSDRIKKFLTLMDSMTKKELDCEQPLTETRVLRISQGAGLPPRELMFLLAEHKRFEKMVGRMGKMNLDGLDNMDAVSGERI